MSHTSPRARCPRHDIEIRSLPNNTQECWACALDSKLDKILERLQVPQHDYGTYTVEPEYVTVDQSHRRRPFWWPKDESGRVLADFIDYDYESYSPDRVTWNGYDEKTLPQEEAPDSRGCSCTRGEKNIFSCWSCDAKD